MPQKFLSSPLDFSAGIPLCLLRLIADYLRSANLLQSVLALIETHTTEEEKAAVAKTSSLGESMQLAALTLK